jgi:hypothetical protein
MFFWSRTSFQGQLSSDLTATLYQIAADDLDNLLNNIAGLANIIRWKMGPHERLYCLNLGDH